MNLAATDIKGLCVADCRKFMDDRGAFFRAFCSDALTPVLGARSIKQINHSLTLARGAVRGMHFQQSPYAEMKLVRCLRGRVADIAIDLRKGSATFLRWHLEELSSENGRMVIIPEGFAHGFQVLEPESELLYLHTAAYTPTAESAVRFDDPLVGIEWPLPVTEISDRDRHHSSLSSSFKGIDLSLTHSALND